MTLTTEHMGLSTDPLMNSAAERKTLTARSLANRFSAAMRELGDESGIKAQPALTGEFVHFTSLNVKSFEKLVRLLEERA